VEGKREGTSNGLEEGDGALFEKGECARRIGGRDLKGLLDELNGLGKLWIGDTHQIGEQGRP
jgi:hypothetical protein